MRIAIISDIHGNLTALDAVMADLHQQKPDVVYQGGDVAFGGSAPAEVIDCIIQEGWKGVLGNTDEMLWDTSARPALETAAPKLKPLFKVFFESCAPATTAMIGESRLAWLRALPAELRYESLALMHASPESLWRAPASNGSDAEMESVYSPLGQPIAIYAHIHHSFLRSVSNITVANTGSVSLSYDGDPRAAYLLLDDFKPSIRRVEYDVEREVKALFACGLPHADWLAKTLRSASAQMP
jgi:predicted phosphodiesterase